MEHSASMVSITDTLDNLLTTTFDKRIAFVLIVGINDGLLSVYSNVENEDAMGMIKSIDGPPDVPPDMPDHKDESPT